MKVQSLMVQMRAMSLHLLMVSMVVVEGVAHRTRLSNTEARAQDEAEESGNRRTVWNVGGPVVGLWTGWGEGDLWEGGRWKVEGGRWKDPAGGSEGETMAAGIRDGIGARCQCTAWLLG